MMKRIPMTEKRLHDSTSTELVRGVHGCLVGASMAFEDQDAQDHAAMLARAEVLLGELRHRLEQFKQDARPPASGGHPPMKELPS